MNPLRASLVANALAWERAYGNAPGITSVISELDAALLIGIADEEYSKIMQGATAVQRGHDFKFGGIRYQIKGTRASGKPGSKVIRVPQATNFDWEKLIWINYNKEYEIQEAWMWGVEEYRSRFETSNRVTPEEMRKGISLLQPK
jgi:hypothetical protein